MTSGIFSGGLNSFEQLSCQTIFLKKNSLCFKFNKINTNGYLAIKYI
jgi:hypothetical protein